MESATTMYQQQQQQLHQQQQPRRSLQQTEFPPPPTSSERVRCQHCMRSLLPPASSPHLFRCPCGEVLRNSNTVGQSSGSGTPSGGGAGSSDHRQQCTCCFKWLIPPAGAPRFRCTCGNILINSRLAASPSASPQHRTSASGAVHARCPRCTQTLVAPPGHSRFRCPCGQMLALTQSRLRCPQCTVVLLPPHGASEFRCPCGVVLRTPAAQLQISAQTAADSAAPQARAVTRGQLDLSNLDNLKLGDPKQPTLSKRVSIRESMLQRQDQRWERSVDPKSLQTLWKLAHSGEVQAPVDQSEQQAWVRSLRYDGTLTWRGADEVDEYTRQEDRAKLYAQVPPTNVQEAVIAASKLPFGQKLTWFRRQIDKLKVPWSRGHQTIRVKRSNLLESSTHAFMHIDPVEFHQIFRFEFVGEPAKDAGGVAREWYDQLTKTLFNADFGLFKTCSDMSSFQINSSSGLFNDHHLLYFHFAGRLMGKAMFDGQLVDAHLSRPLYKHLLGHPILSADLEFVDSELYGNLRMLPSLDEDDIEDLCKTFCVEKSEFGVVTKEDLKPGGANIEVTLENVIEYTQLLVKYYLFSSVQQQLQHLLQGFYEVVPHYLVSVFDSQEVGRLTDCLFLTDRCPCFAVAYPQLFFSFSF